MAEFAVELREAGMVSLVCSYEEVGNMIYGKYEWRDGELWDSFIPEDHHLWDRVLSDNETDFDELAKALEVDGSLEIVVWP